MADRNELRSFQHTARMDSDDVEALKRELADLKVQVRYLKWTVQYVILPILLVILGKLILG
jgi:hypothetical protein